MSTVNPALYGDDLVVSLEPNIVCVLRWRIGAITYCKRIGPGGWGAGHASPAVADGIILQTYDASTSIIDDLRHGFYRSAIAALIGIPDIPELQRPPSRSSSSNPSW